MSLEDNSALESLDGSKIIARLRKGGAEELSRQFMQLRPSIRSMIANRLYGKLLSRLDASDVIQETFIRATNSLQNYLNNPRVHPTIWLRTLSKQIMAEMVRVQFRQKRSPEFEQVSLDDEPIAEFLMQSLDSVGSSLQKAELAARVKELLSRISVTDREIIEMRHADAYSFDEIGGQLEITIEAAKKRYYRALDRFRAIALHDSSIKCADKS